MWNNISIEFIILTGIRFHLNFTKYYQASRSIPNSNICTFTAKAYHDMFIKRRPILYK